ncbi:CPXCG motif-containing cysteine-rich protein [Echinimonas agarilytica]|uniref:CPXCG motif-containing cysteine-rich protein n=1 Tax=Echinimonas agarilytica TaxID=1215918 RepID=A0AA41W5W2_9GAMM|nr:CPXCG motif-containing cysteine-rich protein [Echinimonas agarilytica]MCM2679482.1 CPXCG motif-containing cysteine-rich protein [Echinimonas agarilytica]
MPLPEKKICCPHCDYTYHLPIDDSAGSQDFYDDCPNCCCSFRVRLMFDPIHQVSRLTVDSDDEQIY